VGNVPTSDPHVIVEFHRKLIEKLLESEEVLAALSGETGEIGIRLDEPRIALRLRIDGENTALETVDPSDEPAAGPRISMKWETALKFWRGDLDILAALIRGDIRIEGQDMEPLFRLKSVVYKAREASRLVEQELGWT
jgi:putative sterol carrier protein